jgi:molybdopterin-dependent oxidoreductase alpha subunit
VPAGTHLVRRGPEGALAALPLGLGAVKPKHYREMLAVLWENRRHPLYAWRVLREGVCDGCALGTSGLRDWTIDGVHLCLTRLRLLGLNTMDALDPGVLADVSVLRRMRSREIVALGRLPYPMRRRRGEPGFTRVSWDEALGNLGTRLGAADPDRVACYLTSRGLGNETYFAAQKAWRALGSPHIDNAARLCHSPSTAAMKAVLGVAATTCSYRDWYGTGVVVLFGSNPANDQPVALKYLAEAKKLGTRVLVVNAYEEPGLRRYWIPSMPDSALFGTEIADRFFRVGVGGDQAFVTAALKLLIERGAVDQAFIDAHTTGWPSYREAVLAMDLDDLIRRAGSSREDVIAFADELARARSGVFVWSMGLTQHAHGARTIEAVCALALARGFVGREKCGLMPIRGHSGVQGGAEMGAYATAYPGGRAIDDPGADDLARVWGFRPPARVGMDAARMLDAAADGKVDLLYAIGGNFLDTLPQPDDVERALERIPVRVHQDIVLNSSMLVDAQEAVYLLPAKTRYEHAGGITQTTSERRVVYSPHVSGHDVGEAREEWRIAVDLVRAARLDLRAHLDYPDADAVRADIARTVPIYAGIQHLARRGDQFQWGGPRLCEDGRFGHADGRARFLWSEPPDARPAAGKLRLSTRRGKQFNSIVQGDVDPLTGASRDHVLMHPDDMRERGVDQDNAVLVRSAHGEVRGRAFAAPVARGTAQMHWPEANPLIAPGVRDPGGLVPDYNALVAIERAEPALPAHASQATDLARTDDRRG